MYGAARDIIVMQPQGQSDACGSIVSDFLAMMEHVQGPEQIEVVIAGKPSIDREEGSASLVVLDDATPRHEAYRTVSAYRESGARSRHRQRTFVG
jgi:hypothetical protein